MTQVLSVAAAHAMLYESVAVGTDAEGIESTVELQTQLHDAQRELGAARHNVYRLQQELHDAAIKENILTGKLRTRSKAAASVHKAMLADLLALRSQLQFYYEQQQSNTNRNNSNTTSSNSPFVDTNNNSFGFPAGMVQDVAGPPLGAPYDYASYLDVGRLLEGDSDGMGVDDVSYLPNDMLIVQRMLFGAEVERIQKNLVMQKQHIRSACEDRMAMTEAKIRQMRVQFQEACRVQHECETRISEAQRQAELRIQADLESSAAATSEYVKKFRDEAEATIDQLSVKVSDVTMLLETAQAQNELLTDRVERLQNTKKGLAAKQIAELEQNLDLLYRQVIAKEEEIANAKKQVKEAQAALEAQQQRSDILQEELRRRSDVIEEQDQTISDLKREKERVVRQCRADIEQAKVAMEEEIVKRVAEAAIDPEELEAKIHEIEELKEALRDSEKEAATLSSQLSEARESKRLQTVSNLATIEGLEASVKLHQDRHRDAQATIETLERKLTVSADELLASQRAPPPRPSFGDAIIQMQRVGMEVVHMATRDALPKLHTILDVIDVLLPEGSASKKYLADAHSAALTATHTLQCLLNDVQLLLAANCENPGDMITDASLLLNILQQNPNAIADALREIPLDGASRRLSTAVTEAGQREGEESVVAWRRKHGERTSSIAASAAAAAWSLDASTALTSPTSTTTRSPRKAQKSPRKSSTQLTAAVKSPAVSPPASPTEHSVSGGVGPLSPHDLLSASLNRGVGESSATFGDEVSALASSTRSTGKAPSTKKSPAATSGGPKSIMSASKSSSVVKPAGKSSLTATDTPTSTASAAATAMARNRRRSSSTQPGGNSLASFPDDDGSAIDDDHSYSRASTVAEVGVQWEDTPGGAGNSNSNSSASLLLPRQKSGGAAMKSVPSSFRQIPYAATTTTTTTTSTADVSVGTDPVFISDVPFIAAAAPPSMLLEMRSTSTTDLMGQLVDATTSAAHSVAGSSRPASAASTTMMRQLGGRPGSAGSLLYGNDGNLISSNVVYLPAALPPPPPPPPDPVSEIHRLVAELQEQGPIAPMVVPRALRRDNTIALLQLLAPAEREEFSALAEQLELIPPRVRHVTVHSDSTNDPKNRQRRMEEQQAALESKLCTPQSSVAAARVSSSQLQQSPLTTEEYYRGNSPDRSDEETATTTRDGDAHSLDQEDDAHHNNNGALVVAVAPVAAARNSSSLPPPSVTTMAHHHHSHQNGIGALMHGLIAAVPSFLNSVLESVATASSPSSSSLGQSSHVGLLCQRSLWQVASLLTATPFEDGANASSSKNDPLHAAFTRATRPISELSSSSTSPSSSALYQNAAIAARWCHVLLWALEVCRQQVESAASEMDQWSVPPTTTTHQQQQHQVNGAWEQQLNTSVASGQRSKASQQQQNINTSIELSRPHSAMSSAILRREHQSGVATLPRSMVNQQQAPQQQQPVRVPRFSPTPLSSNSVGPSATWSSAANRLQSMHEQHKKFFENAQQQHNQQPDLLSEHLAFVAASSSPNVAADIRQRGRQVGRAGGLLSNGASTTGRDMYRYGRADVVAAGRMLPRQFTADFDCAVRQTLVSPLEFVVAPDHLGEMITDESALMLLPPRPNSAIPSMVGSKLRLSLHANSTYNVRAQSAGAAGSKSGAGGADDNHKGNQSDDDNMEPRGGGNEATEWTAENALYDEFVKQKRLERVILSQVNSVEGHNNNAPTIRCGSAPLARHGSASGGKRPPIAEAAAPAPSMGDVVVYKGHEQQQQQQTRSTSPTTGDPTVGHEASVVHNGGVRPGRTLKAVYSRQSSAGRGRPSQSKSLNESTYVQPPLPLPEILPVETGAALQRPGSSSLRDKLRSVVQTNGYDSALAKSGASVSASLTSITVAQNTTQRRTIPPPSVFQWQRVVQQSGPFQEQQQLQQPENVGASNVSTTKAVVATTPSSSPAMSSALRNIPQRNNASGTPQPQQSSSTSAPPSKANAPTVLITSEASTHNSNINSSTNTKSQPQQQRTTTTGPTTMLLSSPTAAGQRRTSGGTKPPAAIKLTKSSSVEDSVFASIGTPVQQWSINPDLEASGGFHFRPDDVVDGDADPFAVPDPSFALT